MNSKLPYEFRTTIVPGLIDPADINLNMFPAIPLPNWKITYDGLTQFQIIKQYLRTVNINHSYTSTFTMGGFETNPFYTEDENGFSDELDVRGINFIAQYDVKGITISEQFSPLIGVDMTWNNSLITKLEIKKNRSLNYSLESNTITETVGNDLVIGGGYRLKDVEIVIKSGGRSRPLKSDMNLRADLTYRQLLSVTRKVKENSSDITGGQNGFSLKLSADYRLSERFNIKMFYDLNKNAPKTPPAFKTSTGNFGVSIRFTLV